MSDTIETAPLAVPRDRSVEARRAARQVKASRERRIIASLNRGVSTVFDKIFPQPGLFFDIYGCKFLVVGVPFVRWRTNRGRRPPVSFRLLLYV